MLALPTDPPIVIETFDQSHGHVAASPRAHSLEGRQAKRQARFEISGRTGATGEVEGVAALSSAAETATVKRPRITRVAVHEYARQEIDRCIHFTATKSYERSPLC
jgi:hypothetical protein